MHILIETKNRWRLTLTSPHHDTIEKVDRHGVKPFARRDSGSSLTSTSIVKRSLEAYDIEDSVWPEYRNAQRPSRCRSFRKFCRFVVHVSRKCCFDKTCSIYQEDCEDVETPPPYSRGQASGIFELPEGWSSLRELPVPHSILTGILDQDLPHELEASFPGESDIQIPQTNSLDGQSVATRGETPNEHNHLIMEYTMQYAPLSRPNNLPTPITEQSLYAMPVMTKEGQSRGSSPVSPYTPGRDMNGDLHDPGYSFHNGAVSLNDMPSPNSSPYAAYGRLSYDVNGYHAFTAVAAPIYTAPTKIPAHAMVPSQYLANQVANQFSTSAFSFNRSVPYQHMSEELGLLNHEKFNTATSGYDYDPRIGTWEVDQNSKWIRKPNQGEVAEHAAHRHLLRSDNAVYGHNQAVDRAEDSQDDVFSNVPGNVEQSSPHLKEVCNQCGTGFTGEYRKGNLARHIRERHTSIRSVVGRTCRKCRKVFNRSDARRKHEWKQYRLADAKPSKRRAKEPQARHDDRLLT